jgi:hypothetical protein
MSPIVHAELSWLCSQPLVHRRDRILVTVAGVLPDLDGLAILGGLDAYGRWHHRLTHGAIAAVLTVVLCSTLSQQRFKTPLLGAITFHLHLLCDLVGSGPGWAIWYLWPFRMDEWYWAGQWDLGSWQNGLIGMIATALCLLGAVWWRRTIVEVFSVRADQRVTAALRSRLGRAT